MTPEELQERIRLGEDSRTELKDERAQPDDLAATVVSFANAAGGELVLGVANDRAVPGVSDLDGATLRIDFVFDDRVEIASPCRSPEHRPADPGARSDGSRRRRPRSARSCTGVPRRFRPRFASGGRTSGRALVSPDADRRSGRSTPRPASRSDDAARRAAAAL
ncbi:MAG: ATP-binding protein [Deltaproteobacteria bacterium]|nr:ATP-binding protein [Deltaproteobacteria bacterium]